MSVCTLHALHHYADTQNNDDTYIDGEEYLELLTSFYKKNKSMNDMTCTSPELTSTLKRSSSSALTREEMESSTRPRKFSRIRSKTCVPTTNGKSIRETESIDGYEEKQSRIENNLALFETYMKFRKLKSHPGPRPLIERSVSGPSKDVQKPTPDRRRSLSFGNDSQFPSLNISPMGLGSLYNKGSDHRIVQSIFWFNNIKFLVQSSNIKGISPFVGQQLMSAVIKNIKKKRELGETFLEDHQLIEVFRDSYRNATEYVKSSEEAKVRHIFNLFKNSKEMAWRIIRFLNCPKKKDMEFDKKCVISFLQEVNLFHLFFFKEGIYMSDASDEYNWEQFNLKADDEVGEKKDIVSLDTSGFKFSCPEDSSFNILQKVVVYPNTMVLRREKVWSSAKTFLGTAYTDISNIWGASKGTSPENGKSGIQKHKEKLFLKTQKCGKSNFEQLYLCKSLTNDTIVTQLELQYGTEIIVLFNVHLPANEHNFPFQQYLRMWTLRKIVSEFWKETSSPGVIKNIVVAGDFNANYRKESCKRAIDYFSSGEMHPDIESHLEEMDIPVRVFTDPLNSQELIDPNANWLKGNYSTCGKMVLDYILGLRV